MGTIVIGKIIDDARVTLLEVGGDLNPSPTDIRWSRTGELLNHANRLMREIVNAKADAGVKNTSFQLGAGAKQTIPSDGVQFFGLEHNLGADGNTPGQGILVGDRGSITRANKNWMTASGTAVERFIHDQRDPKTFYVYPRPSGTWWVNLLYAAVPSAISAANIDASAIPIDDLYDAAMHDYIVGYSLLKNQRAGEMNKAVYFLQKFYNFIGRKLEAQMLVAPLDAEAAEAAPDALGKA
jgi:hypothetical protein